MRGLRKLFYCVFAVVIIISKMAEINRIMSD